MTNTVSLKNNTICKQASAVLIPNCAIDELSLSALGFYGTILDMIQNAKVTFKNKEDLITRMSNRTPNESRRSAEKACEELIRKGYINFCNEPNGESVDITLGSEFNKEGERQ